MTANIDYVETSNPVRESFLVFGEPDIQEAEIEEVIKTLRSRWIGMGPRCLKFEEMFSQYIGSKHAISLNSCTAGLELALEVLGVGPGDEVITTPLTFCATANVIVHRGATPVFVDVDRSTGSIDCDQVSAAITEKTKAIMPVHLYGWPCQVDRLSEIAKKHGLFVIEDAAHAVESWYRGRKIGTVGDMTVFSFYANKNMTTGEGGMIVTDNDEWAHQLRVRRLHGLSHDAWKRYSTEGFQPYDVTAAGYKFNMTDLQAALGIHQLQRLDQNLQVRERYWDLYDEAFAGLPEISLLTPPPYSAQDGPEKTRHARHLYTILLNPEKTSLSRWDFLQALKRENIGTGIHYIALHLLTFYREKFGYRRGAFPNAEFISDRTISLPLSPAMRPDDVQDVVKAVKKVLA